MLYMTCILYSSSHCSLSFFELYGEHRDLDVLTHSFPTRRSSDLSVVPTTISTTAVSAVGREAISDGRFSSNQRGASRSRLRWTAIRTSATVRSPSHDTKYKRAAEASASPTTTPTNPWK